MKTRDLENLDMQVKHGSDIKLNIFPTISM